MCAEAAACLVGPAAGGPRGTDPGSWVSGSGDSGQALLKLLSLWLPRPPPPWHLSTLIPSPIHSCLPNQRPSAAPALWLGLGSQLSSGCCGAVTIWPGGPTPRATSHLCGPTSSLSSLSSRPFPSSAWAWGMLGPEWPPSLARQPVRGGAVVRRFLVGLSSSSPGHVPLCSLRPSEPSPGFCSSLGLTPLGDLGSRQQGAFVLGARWDPGGGVSPKTSIPASPREPLACTLHHRYVPGQEAIQPVPCVGGAGPGWVWPPASPRTRSVP